jgi:hypothetical protein
MWLVKLFTGFLGGPISDISDDIRRAHQASLDAKTDSETLTHETRRHQLSMQRDAMIRSKGAVIMRASFGIPFVVYLWKLVIWDKVLGWGVTDPLSSTLEYVLFAIVGFYFLTKLIKN